LDDGSEKVKFRLISKSLSSLEGALSIPLIVPYSVVIKDLLNFSWSNDLIFSISGVMIILLTAKLIRDSMQSYF